MLIFDRCKGEIRTEDGALIASDIWAGHGDAHNDPSREREKGIGPLPAGVYTFSLPRDGGHLGPFVMDLIQIEGESFDRSLFSIHGNNKTPWLFNASDGCIVAPFAVRRRINRETDRRIKVI